MSHDTTPAAESPMDLDTTFSLVDPADRGDDATPTPTPETSAQATAAKTAAPSTNGAAKTKAKPAPKPPASAGDLADRATKAAARNKAKAADKAGGLGVAAPPETPVNHDLKGLVIDRRLQMRASLFDEQTVEKYRELFQENPESLPPIRVMEIPQEEADSLKLASNLVVWDGFQRAEARKRAKLKGIPTLVSKGTWELARLLALRANHDAALPRSQPDLRRAVQQLINDETLLKEVLEWGKGKGGPQRAMAAAVGVSVGLVNKILGSMGKGTDRNGIVDLSPTRAASATARHQRAGDPDAAIRTESLEAIQKRATAVIIKEMQNAAASLQRRAEALLTREDAANLFREVAKKCGHPIVRHEEAGGERPAGQTAVVVAEYLPPVDAILLIVDELAEKHKRMTTDATK
jgi:hypothetical protein